MAARQGPTYLRVALGKEFQALRNDKGDTAEAVSVALGWSRSRVSRLEAGEIPLPKLEDLHKLLDHLDVIDPDDRDTLVRMHKDSLKKEPFTSYRNMLPSGMPMYLGLERDASGIRGYENINVHGLLQCESYASALMGSAKVVEERTTDAVETSVRLRMERKNLLLAEGGPELHIILTENTLTRQIGTPAVMREQYAEIERLARLDNVDVQIIPELGEEMYRAAFNFTILDFPGLESVVQSDSHRATTMWSKHSDLGQYQRQFQAMAKAAPGPSATPQILHNLENKLWK
ncbi:helix-turn-helix domain-containing protein [Streptomyces virginiae]|uniref:helix-turn-helix domain-containing protein n=1 Tax=Streptomyces virginiae TaxID=1961 RepID=UPI002256F7F5|nr:helix-turn-helix transcriptional regulator [Streptomyces virginiae]MCX5174227.1 helix-turn-helix domain-containing protein [Streptomyces virginiae]